MMELYRVNKVFPNYIKIAEVMLFKSARNLVSEMNSWSKDEMLRNRVRLIVDGGTYILFFRSQGRLYGANEGSRVTFAKFRDESDDDNDSGWRNHAYFTASDLVEQANGKQTTAIFGQDDIAAIQVIKELDVVRHELLELVLKSEGEHGK